MNFSANTQYEASLQLLQPIWKNDYKNSWHPTGIIATEYVYFDLTHCRFYFSSEQLKGDRKTVSQLLKRYRAEEKYNAVEIVASKYCFSRLLLGAVAHRKMFSYREFFELVKDRPELF